MRACWIDSGNDPNYFKMAMNGMTALYFDMFDPRISPGYLSDVQARGYSTGLYMATNWPYFFLKTPEEIAKITSDRVNAVGLPTTRVQLDMEEHLPTKILNVLRAFRAHQPKRNVSWTMEAFQGGWMTPEFVAEVVALKIRVVPQYYKGTMGDLSLPCEQKYQSILAALAASDAALKDMLKAGYPYPLVTGFYDAAALPWNWDGFAFVQGRLP